MLLCLSLFAACSTIGDVKDPAPPGFLLEKVEPLPESNIQTNRDLADRLIFVESAHERLRARFNILIDWIAPPES